MAISINTAAALDRALNDYEIAILRILVKRGDMMKVQEVIDGFPDNSKDDVALAISKLIAEGYVSQTEVLPNSFLAVKKEKRKEVLRLVSPGQDEPAPLQDGSAVSSAGGSVQQLQRKELVLAK